MKKSKNLFLILLLIGFVSFGQAPQGFSYQAVIRNASDAIVANASVGMRISVLQGSVSGSAVYVETHVSNTNGNGLLTLNVGGGSVVSGSLATLDWTAGPYFIKTETDPTGGTSYSITGTAQILSVPYALYAVKAGSSAAAGTDTQITFNNSGVASGSVNNTWDNVTNTHTVVGTSVTTNERVSSLAGLGTRVVLTDASGNLTVSGATGATGTGNTNYHTKFVNGPAGVIGNSMIQDNGTSVSINYPVQSNSQLFVYRQQLTANGDGQSTIYGYRDRNNQNVGASYGQNGSNTGLTGMSFWGDDYSFGVGGWNYNDFSRTGGVVGGEIYGNYWGSLGYKAASTVTYGVYGSNAFNSGTGRLANNLTQGVGGGFFGMIGSMTKGNVIGQINAGDLFSSYNSGNVYTLGKNIELVENVDQTKTAVYSVTSTESTIYAKGKAQLVNGEVYIAFNDSYKKLLGEEPEVTVSPKGNCNGIYIASIDKNGFTVKELNNGNSDVAISWISVGNRIDSRLDAATKMVEDKNFDKNIQQVLFNDGSNLQSKGTGIWWNGNSIQFGTMPESLSKVVRTSKEVK
ncbi:hypothetical protein [Flavobacterium difficile]|uniref:Uncharacterized protein n=1 Tax=Flavobacterium difficile TaxID=2709659 RepID=A0ABX0I1M1_9FLAO|nr:hypothetical protein [Flavobacterium difficile]NHM00596.1 hypothetical protein [Flavobacterium difficile]